jgi:hypothetical protein
MPKCSWRGADGSHTIIGAKCGNCGHRDLIHDWDGCAMCEIKDIKTRLEEEMDAANKKGS